MTVRRPGTCKAKGAPAASDAEVSGGGDWTWMVVAGGAALGAAALIWLVWHRDPARRMDRILQRCQERIQDIETSLGQLETSLRSSPS